MLDLWLVPCKISASVEVMNACQPAPRARSREGVKIFAEIRCTSIMTNTNEVVVWKQTSCFTHAWVFICLSGTAEKKWRRWPSPNMALKRRPAWSKKTRWPALSAVFVSLTWKTLDSSLVCTAVVDHAWTRCRWRAVISARSPVRCVVRAALCRPMELEVFPKTSLESRSDRVLWRRSVGRRIATPRRRCGAKSANERSANNMERCTWYPLLAITMSDPFRPRRPSWMASHEALRRATITENLCCSSARNATKWSAHTALLSVNIEDTLSCRWRKCRLAKKGGDQGCR